MKELLRTNDPTIIAFATALLGGEGIDCFPMDDNMSVLEGSIGILPRRLMVRSEDHTRAARVMTDNGIVL
ncbi:putative signal transducing protein [Pseudoroseicyclus sp. H15]